MIALHTGLMIHPTGGIDPSAEIPIPIILPTFQEMMTGRAVTLILTGHRPGRRILMVLPGIRNILKDPIEEVMREIFLAMILIIQTPEGTIRMSHFYRLHLALIKNPSLLSGGFFIYIPK